MDLQGSTALQEVFPGPWSISIAASAVRESAEFAGVRILLSSEISPPDYNAVYCKFGRIMGLSHIEGPGIFTKVVESIGDGDAVRIGAEIMVIDQLGDASPAFTGITKASDEFFFLGVYADCGKVCVNGPFPKRSNETELLVAVGVVRLGQLLMIHP